MKLFDLMGSEQGPANIKLEDNGIKFFCTAAGTVSILASRHVRGAVGVESVYSAVTDARKNALANGVYNVEFIPGLAEKVSHACWSETE